jgi:hypothetical protein
LHLEQPRRWQASLQHQWIQEQAAPGKGGALSAQCVALGRSTQALWLR